MKVKSRMRLVAVDFLVCVFWLLLDVALLARLICRRY